MVARDTQVHWQCHRLRETDFDFQQKLYVRHVPFTIYTYISSYLSRAANFSRSMYIWRPFILEFQHIFGMKLRNHSLQRGTVCAMLCSMPLIQHWLVKDRWIDQYRQADQATAYMAYMLWPCVCLSISVNPSVLHKPMFDI